MTTPFTLSLAAVDVIWEDLGLGVPVYPLDVPRSGIAHDEHAAIRAAVLDDLARRGLARDGRVEPRVAAAFTTMAAPDVSVSAIGMAAGRELLALAVSTHERAVLAVQDGQHLSIDHPRPSNLVEALLGLLPDIRRGIGQSVTISTGPGARSEKALARSCLTRPRTAFGRLSVSGSRAVPFDLNWFDTDRGRYVCYSRTGQGGGATWITYAPADRRDMAHLLSEAAAGSRPGHGWAARRSSSPVAPT
ncbi:MAG: hypothetical protein GEV28_08755 [Actinophytocola sp.]|uniref:ESX secretion-associated protein EspG n=1 Tax=Actinophytocola sp. TaxID=1872138 RepID=UPI0013214FE2|nr:ESX secretion-associated protein EspG [Actinophytocola sp.]MPZ80467.1 hypothetical protein [Actinophytocola sp.]